MALFSIVKIQQGGPDSVYQKHVYRAYYIISDRSMGYGVVQNTPEYPMDGGGHAAWDYPADMDVLHDIEEASYA